MEDPGSIPELGRSPGEGNGNPLQNSCLESPMDGRAWQAIIHWVAKRQTRLSGFISLHFMYVYIGLSCSSAGKESTSNAGGSSLIPGLERGRLPTPVFFDFPIDLSGRESTAL